MSDKIYDTNGKEVSVAWAAKRIRCSERSILYYLKERKLEGIKVGKSWFIDRASVEAHCSRYGIAEPEDMQGANTPADSDIVTEEGKSEQIHSQENSQNQSTQQTSGSSGTNYTGKKRRPPKPITTLNVYKLFEQAIREAQPSLSQEDSDPCLARIFNLQLSALEELGGGYYSQNRELKMKKYSEARSYIGSILSILHANSECAKQMKAYIKQLEEEVLPALSALIRYIELDKGSKKKSYYRNNDSKDRDEGRSFYDGGSDR